ncbi:hypothetical protein [Amycolatopsis sp. NBC_01480]|uniref:hypothetical protein n=1 Tax=Amycolatopsis sp. NBC_01480 TaxID=2903562 RepID=UPI002E294D1F|nr:hypothetical protein [Amycolatopsis sp. NBC_01480]
MTTTSDLSAPSRRSRSIWTSLAVGALGVAASIAFAAPANAAPATTGGGTETGASSGGGALSAPAAVTPYGTRIGGFGVSPYGSAGDRSDGTALTTVDSYMSGQPDAHVAGS